MWLALGDVCRARARGDDDVGHQSNQRVRGRLNGEHRLDDARDGQKLSAEAAHHLGGHVVGCPDCLLTLPATLHGPNGLVEWGTAFVQQYFAGAQRNTAPTCSNVH